MVPNWVLVYVVVWISSSYSSFFSSIDCLIFGIWPRNSSGVTVVNAQQLYHFFLLLLFLQFFPFSLSLFFLFFSSCAQRIIGHNRIGEGLAIDFFASFFFCFCFFFIFSEPLIIDYRGICHVAPATGSEAAAAGWWWCRPIQTFGILGQWISIDALASVSNRLPASYRSIKWVWHLQGILWHSAAIVSYRLFANWWLLDNFSGFVGLEILPGSRE